jgi:hypothetical protein
MADRSSAAIRIGGRLHRTAIPALVTAIEIEGVSTDWEGEPFSVEDLVEGQALYLVANEVAGGEFEHLEDFCRRHGLAYARSRAGFCGSYGPERVVFDGNAPVLTFVATDDDEVLISLEDIEKLGSIAAIRAHFAKANAPIPPLALVGSVVPADAVEIERRPAVPSGDG